MATEPTVPDWQLSRLEQLPAPVWHRIMQARQQVFVVEQNCPYLDADTADPASWHLVAWQHDGEVAAYARIVDPGINYSEPSIGRVLTSLAMRRCGLGRELMRRAIVEAGRIHPGRRLRISAQAHLQVFYADFGFVAVGAEYLEDGIPHIEMLRGAD
ncbi:GNAT family N-acetyltransferase [Piscinibacter sakaiensis]|uniref:GNAT family N-acetyltransferase n=1 Tax=Piscinibacter sakaiensis TaxID=1547922 RepID=UPI003AAB5314